MWSQVTDTTGTYNPGFDFIKDLTDNPWRYEAMWSAWTPVTVQEPGLMVTIGDDEELVTGKYYFFAVQAKDYGGNVTGTFTRSTNIRHFMVKKTSGPYLRIYEPVLGGFRFISTPMDPETKKLPAGIQLRFRWRGDTSAYYGELAGYRYGWDISDLLLWDDPYDPGLTGTLATTFYSGIHTLFIEAIDRAGNLTRGRITIEIVPWPMDRDLLWVDDLYSTNNPIPNHSWPPEYEHDRFWTHICSKVTKFDPGTDIYDCHERYSLPDIEFVGRYKNVIWTYSRGNDYWSEIIHFTPESHIDKAANETTNIISIFLKKGGHIWTLGRSDRGGGLAAVLDPQAMSFPMNLACEITGNSDGCEGDRSGTGTMAYDDYCITMLDKISGSFRQGDDMPWRSVTQYDVLRYAYKDPNDPVTAGFPGIPGRLRLKDQVTATGMFFSTDSTSSPGGFTYVEVYNPEYWMDWKAVYSQHCFHPAYRMRAADRASVMNDCVVAFWITKYDDIVPDVVSGAAVAAPSIHFGFPLWFFREDAVDSIAGQMFECWGLETGG